MPSKALHPYSGSNDAPLLVMLDGVAAAGKPSELFYRCAGEAYKEHGMVPDE